MPSTSAVAKKSTSGVKPSSSKEGTSAEATPTRISSRVRKEKFSVKELFNQKDTSNEDSPKKGPKKKIVPVVENKGQSAKENLTKSHIVKIPLIPKVQSVKVQNAPKTPTIKKIEHPSSSLPGPSKIIDPIKSQKTKSKTLLIEDKADHIFTENNIETVLENPSSLGLEVVVTRLSDSDNKELDEAKDKSNTVVTISKVTSGTPSGTSKAVKIVPMKPDKKCDTEKTNLSKGKSSSVENINFKDKGVTVTTKVNEKIVAASKPTLVAEKKVKPVQRTIKLIPEEMKKSVDSKLEIVSTDPGSHIVSLRTIEDKKKDNISSTKPKSIHKSLDIEKPHKTNHILTLSDTPKSLGPKQKTLKNTVNIAKDVGITVSIVEPKSNGIKSTRVETVKVKRKMESESSSEDSILESVKRVKLDNTYVDLDEEKQAVTEFGRYFTTRETLVEHNESLDSDDSIEIEESLLSHFVSERISKQGSPSMTLDSEETTIYDLMAEVSVEMPAWNLHVLQDTGSFLLAHVSRGTNGLPVMNKIIELESDFNAKVYVNQIFQREFCGVYNSYESIRDLIISVNQL